MTDPQQKKPKRKPIKLEMPANLGVTYANFALITHSLSEVILDFAQMLPNMPKARVMNRVLMSPTNAKLFYRALGESLAKYEQTNGEIKVPPTLADQLFRTVGTTPPGEEGDEGGAGGDDE